MSPPPPPRRRRSQFAPRRERRVIRESNCQYLYYNVSDQGIGLRISRVVPLGFNKRAVVRGKRLLYRPYGDVECIKARRVGFERAGSPLRGAGKESRLRGLLDGPGDSGSPVHDLAEIVGVFCRYQTIRTVSYSFGGQGDPRCCM